MRKVSLVLLGIAMVFMAKASTAALNVCPQPPVTSCQTCFLHTVPPTQSVQSCTLFCQNGVLRRVCAACGEC